MGIWAWSGCGSRRSTKKAKVRAYTRGSEILFKESAQKPLFILHFEKKLYILYNLLNRCFPEPVYRLDFVSQQIQAQGEGTAIELTRLGRLLSRYTILHIHICSSHLFRYSGKANTRVHGIWHDVSVSFVHTYSLADPMISGIKFRRRAVTKQRSF